MTAELKKNENNQAVYTTSLDWDQFEAEVEKVFRRNRNRFNIPGFRKGHAPRKIIEANYGEGIFYDDALNQLLPDLIEQATEELGLEAIGQPDIDVQKLDKGEDIIFEVTTETMPHPTLGDYRQIEVEVPELEVSDQEVEDRINQVREQNAIYNPVEDRPAAEGDQVTIDYAGSLDGVPFEGGTADHQVLTLGSHTFIPGFEEGLVGHEAGDEFDLPVTFPEDYGAEDLAGKEAVFHIVLHDIKVKELPAADDDFAQDVSEFDSLEEYKADIRQKLEDQLKENIEASVQDQAVEQLIEVSNIQAPDALIDDQVETEIRIMANQMQNMGISFSDYLQYSQASLDDLRQEVRPRAEMKANGILALNSLVEEQGFEASQEEVDEEIRKLAESYEAQDVEAFAEEIKKMGNEPLVIDDVKKKKALEYLASVVKRVPVKHEEEEAAAEQPASDAAEEAKPADEKADEEQTEE